MRRPRNHKKKQPAAPRLQGGGAKLSGNKFKLPRGVYYDSKFLSTQNKDEILKWLSGIFPIWEMRYSAHNPPPEGQNQRMLLRPVYWLGNWQFACLDYYHPPKNVENCCVQAEPFPHCLQYLVQRMEDIVRDTFEARDIPRGWHLNTCLINYYGHKIEGDRKIDTARVGEHRDFEPGPVASLSIGERAFFQFVSSRKIGSRDSVAFEQWLDDSSLQIFGGHRFKSELFHRVQRVEKKNTSVWKFNVDDFETRRINFTFRYVPDEHVIAYSQLPPEKAEDIRPYVQKLAEKSEFFKNALSKRN